VPLADALFSLLARSGHACTPEMIERTCEFIYREGLAATCRGGAGEAATKKGKM